MRAPGQLRHARQSARVSVPLSDDDLRPVAAGGPAGYAAQYPDARLHAKAQAHPPYEGWGYGERLRVRGLTDAVCGMPTAALADEILLEGEGQVKALICVGGNPMAAWPDQRKTQRALESLELLVTLDTEMSLTSRLADYVIAPKMQMETPAMTQGSELIKYYTSGTGIPAAYAQYAPRLVDPPAGSDLIEEWEFFLGLAKRMELEMWFVNFFGGGGGRFMESPPVVVNINGTPR